MPSTVVHMAFAGMIGAALLGETFDRRSLLVVLAATIFADLDSFLSWATVVGHRAAFHTLLLPLTVAVLLAVDLYWRETSWVETRWGHRGVRIAWVTTFAYAASAIGLDLFSVGGVNPLWPLHDQFYFVNGKLELSSQRGIVQTFVDLGGEETSGPTTQARGSTQEVHVSTGVDPNRGAEPEDVDRVFPIVRSGWQLLLLLVGTTVTIARLYVDHTVGGESGGSNSDST